MKPIFLIFCLGINLLVSSCATASFSHLGVGRIKQYDFYSEQLPEAFNGFRIAFASDFHYESRFNHKRLPLLIKTLQSTQSDVLLLGGDYIGRNGGDMQTLFQALSKVNCPYGTYAVLGNHERGTAEKEVRKAMEINGVKLLEHRTDTLWAGQDKLLICGIRNPFDLKNNGISPTCSLKEKDFVILLTHTPDYIEDTHVTNTDLALAGHTHGGQVSLFKRWTPAHFSKYENRFLTGLKYNRQGIPIIITNGIGTSRKDIRLFTPSEVVVIILHCQKDTQD